MTTFPMPETRHEAKVMLWYALADYLHVFRTYRDMAATFGAASPEAAALWRERCKARGKAKWLSEWVRGL